MTTTPQAALLSDEDDLSIYEVAQSSYRRHKSGCRGQMISAADDFEWHLMRATEQAVIAKLQPAQETAIDSQTLYPHNGPYRAVQLAPVSQEPVQAGDLPEPFGYVSDGFPDGLHFQHKPWPEIHLLLNSVAPVYSAAQMRAALSARKPLTPLIARQLGEWHEDDGPVMWWAWNGHGWAGEPAWCGQPTDSDWPGYHTHWTPHPQQPATNGIGLKVKP